MGRPLLVVALILVLWLILSQAIISIAPYVAGAVLLIGFMKFVSKGRNDFDQ